MFRARNMGMKKTKTKQKIWQRIKRIAFVLIAVVALLLTAATTYLYLKQDQLTAELVNQINSKIEGRISYEKISVSPFAHFPKLSLEIQDFKVYPNRTDTSQSAAIAEIESFYMVLSLVALAQGNISISELHFEQGFIITKENSSGQFDLAIALGPMMKKKTPKTKSVTPHKKPKKKAPAKPKKKTKPSKTTTTNVTINVDRLLLENVNIEVLGYNKIYNGKVFIEDLNTRLKYQGDSINMHLYGKCLLQKLFIKNKSSLSDLALEIDSKFNLNILKQHLNLNKSLITLNEAAINMQGQISLDQSEATQVTFAASDKDFNLAQLVFSKKGLKNFEKGDIYLRGSYEQLTKNTVPKLNILFGCTGLRIKVPKTNQYIEQLSLNGSFTSGDSARFKAAVLQVDSLFANVPGGQVKGNIVLQEFHNPLMDLSLKGTIDMDGLDELFKIQSISELSGKVNLDILAKNARYFLDVNSFQKEKFRGHFDLHDIQFRYLDKDSIYIHGSVHQNEQHVLSADSLLIYAGGTSINTRGKISYPIALVLPLDTFAVANMDISATIDSLPTFINTPLVKHLEGSILCSFHLQDFNLTSDFKSVKPNSAIGSIQFNEVTLDIPNTFLISQINGGLHGNFVKLNISNLSAQIRKSDFTLNGEIEHVIDFLRDDNLNLMANLDVQSNNLDLAGLLHFAPIVKQNFPYQIKELDLGVVALTSMERIKQHDVIPGMTFSIKSIEGYVQDFLPPLSSQKGIIDFTIENEIPVVRLKDFAIHLDDGLINAEMDYYIPDGKQNWLEIKGNLHNVDPAYYLAPRNNHIEPELVKGNLNTNCSIYWKFPRYIGYKLDALKINLNNLNFSNDSTQIACTNAELSLNRTKFNNQNDFLKTLQSKVHLKVEDLDINHISDLNFDYDITANQGVYDIDINQSVMFGKKGVGKYHFEPYLDTPYYHFHYAIDNYPSSALMLHYYPDTLIKGNLDVDMRMDMKVIDKAHPFKYIDGNLYVDGTNLELYGFDIDKMIHKFEKSQNFNLVDVGSVVFFGPAGLAFSKGSNYADLALSNYETRSKINHIHLEVNAKDGLFSFKDVAFSTNDYRLAVDGMLSTAKDSINITYAVVDEKGCSIIDQSTHGDIRNPERSKVRFFSTIMAPFTNLWNNAVKDCEPFYTGRVAHPHHAKN